MNKALQRTARAFILAALVPAAHGLFAADGPSLLQSSCVFGGNNDPGNSADLAMPDGDSKGLLLVRIQADSGAQAPVAVSYKGIALQPLRPTGTADAGYLQTWYLAQPPAGGSFPQEVGGEGMPELVGGVVRVQVGLDQVGLQVPLQDPGQEAPPAVAEEDGVLGLPGSALAQVFGQGRQGGPRQGHQPGLLALADDPHAGPVFIEQVEAAEAHGAQFRDAQAGAIDELQRRPVPQAGRLAGIRGVQEPLELVLGQRARKGPGLLSRAQDGDGVGRDVLVLGEVAVEVLQGRGAARPAGGAVVALGLAPGQIGTHHLGLEFRGLQVQALVGQVVQEQHQVGEVVQLGGIGKIALRLEVLAEGLQALLEARELGHGADLVALLGVQVFEGPGGLGHGLC